jgi:two-component system response regulator RegX3
MINALRGSGFDVEVVSAVAEIFAAGRIERHWAFVADDTLGGDATELAVVEEVRRRSGIPIIVVTTSTVEDNVVAFLEAGADQCITKPLRMREFVARVRAAVRRTSGPTEEPVAIEIGGVRLDPVGYVVTVGGREVRLTNKEFDLLHLLMTNAGQTLTRRVIVDRVWGAAPPDTKTLDTHIRRLRAKIENDPSVPKRITTVRKVGYRYQRPTRARS